MLYNKRSCGGKFLQIQIVNNRVDIVIDSGIDIKGWHSDLLLAESISSIGLGWKEIWQNIVK